MPGIKAARPLTPADESLLTAAVAIRQDPNAAENAFMARQLVQCTLPHSDPGNVELWQRRNGAYTLTISPFRDRKTRKALYPYGSIPRLLLFWVVTEATQKRSRHICLGHSLDAFMRSIGLDPRTGGGKRGDAKRLQLQMDRLFRCTISFDDERPDHRGDYSDMQIAPDRQTWWSADRTEQGSLFETWIELSEKFYDAVIAAPIPVDFRALKALKRSPLALDLYAWTSYTTFNASVKHQARTIPWDGLHAQMGGEYGQLRVFRAKVLIALRKVKAVYPALHFSSSPDGLTVYPSTPAISGRAQKPAR